jgi:hypothetical protein
MMKSEIQKKIKYKINDITLLYFNKKKKPLEHNHYDTTT